MFQEVEAIDGGVAEEGAGTGTPDKYLWLQKTQNCTHSAPGRPQSPLSNGICTSVNVSKMVVQAQPSLLHLSPWWPYLFYLDIGGLLHVMLKVQAAEPQVSDCAYLNVTGFWQLRHYCINAHRCIILTLIPLYQNPGVLLISPLIIQSRSSPDSCCYSCWWLLTMQ